MNILWQVTYISLGAFIVFIIPTFIYYYEADEEWTCVILFFFNLFNVFNREKKWNILLSTYLLWW